ncbi:hypothetical protein LTR56_017779 [Elasticomyces elasticus]|nr:hypothetical protein LTR56_017779 [Elasticomyces elasticus]KAK3662279.1 hypothetical protein LTR22_006812 [Elasticomyces elasticus]KAK4924782.1 hypothetical protein LTR49_008231 [Elasticomyces elasticus]KAK5766812.1 hypothetical protein LTS12_002888 [Elasticomyces elasticus]
MAFAPQAPRPHPKDVAANGNTRRLQEMHAYSNTPLATLTEPFGPQPFSDDNEIYQSGVTILHVSQDTGGLPSASEREQYLITKAPSETSSSSSSSWKRTTDQLPICVVRSPGKLASAHNKKTFHAPSVSRPEKPSELAPELFTLETRLLTLNESFHGVPSSSSTSTSSTTPGLFTISRDYRKDKDADGQESTILFTNAADGRAVQFDLRADHIMPFLWVVWEGKPVARIKRVAMLRGWGITETIGRVVAKGWKLEYEALVAANVDLSLISAICICLEGLKYGRV